MLEMKHGIFDEEKNDLHKHVDEIQLNSKKSCTQKCVEKPFLIIV